METKQYKYRINELMNKLPISDYKKLLRIAPSELRVTPTTFNNYRNIRADDPDDLRDIPHEKVLMLERLFSIGPGELENFTITTRSLADISFTEPDDTEARISKKFNLNKP